MGRRRERKEGKEDIEREGRKRRRDRGRG